MRSKTFRAAATLLAAVLGALTAPGVHADAAAAGAASGAAVVADTVYRHGYVYTVDARDSVQQALAIRAGRIIYVGGDSGAAAFTGPKTRVVDLQGRMVMPGLVDGHSHPMQGGATLIKCNLNYEQLRVEQMQARIQSCLDQTRAREPNDWLEVVNWFQEAMLPPGTITNRGTLDALKTKRPIFVASSFGHTALVNSRALDLAGVTASTPDPLGGRFGRDASGNPTGILEDAAQETVAKQIPAPTPADNVKAAAAALDAFRKQGVTTFLDAMAEAPALEAFATVQGAGKLTARAHFAVLITPPQGPQPQQAVAMVKALARRYDQGEIGPDPTLTVRNVKLFLDGVIAAPALTGAMLMPYFSLQGAPANPHWAPSSSRGPEVYFPAPVLSALLIEVAEAGFEPHLHADGDRAVREGLDGIGVLRRQFPERDIRVAIAHDEIVDPADFTRFKQLNVIPVLSFQWEKQAPDTMEGAREYLGPARFKYMEPAGFLAVAGARIAYGSDWPVDPLDEWFALKVGVTRTNAPQPDHKYAGRLSEDKGLSRPEVLRAITMNSSYELHQDLSTGSLEVGKLADLIVLDRNFFDIPAEQIADIKVLQTVVGGKVVYQSDQFAGRGAPR
ncbi:MAG TPA: amidohydrolase [Steroidobacteraceae bacterium]|nr:amidohydrolase [Steroidobacteraceae bacterium]